ncbi:hypothetical protein LB515_08685 [Mesorhizobium sp. CA15]|uniref:hypothetical protein n=1 Tax=unclassified Mesorhizobium TaxID=325217 RepID=UPI001CC915C7|nr:MULTISPECIES: hypothetical protein [unclassified Mesorhizobium]MBZ9733300.1 hypothetical protein [Mesorhizobium sp. CA9]MBZ9825912.1 hypothetical protein [Mesorhizobium sp. CA18]MBZ9831135.1 hypothetical protein [Mesorhizobium sp. CA2]MBZ9835190.1 hypothetical protein [Mesorhizobium sp. CA3]MBZ9865449.1 hypothetical protein [Mesorhizobium sp. CA15]
MESFSGGGMLRGASKRFEWLSKRSRPSAQVDINQLRNFGVHIINNSVAGGTATIVVVGAPRSGTSMVAATLDSLGVYLGAQADKAVFEDLEFADAIENAPDELPAMIGRYNSVHNVWGFKRPMAFQSVGSYLHLFREPRLVIPFRDPVAIAKREEISMVCEFRDQLRRAVELNLEIVNLIEKLTVPALLVSYEKAIFQPASFVAALADFCGLQSSDRVKSRAVDVIRNGPELYLKMSQIRFPF